MQVFSKHIVNLTQTGFHMNNKSCWICIHSMKGDVAYFLSIIEVPYSYLMIPTIVKQEEIPKVKSFVPIV